MTPQQVMNLHAKSFSWAARFLSAEARRDAAQLYAFARLADDLADEESLGAREQRFEQLHTLERQVLHPDAGNDLGHQVGRMLRAKGVQPEVVRYFMMSLIQDTQPRRIQSTEELLQFAYGVAGTVGQMMCPILGTPEQAQTFAVAMGVAMQLTNIARDVVEDAARGRCYIPAQWDVGMDGLRAPHTTKEAALSFAALYKLLQLADDFYSYSLRGLDFIPIENRRAIQIATALYRGIGEKILRRGAGHYWRGRTSLGRSEKIKIIASCYFGGNNRRHMVGRDVVGEDLRHLAALPGFPVIG